MIPGPFFSIIALFNHRIDPIPTCVFDARERRIPGKNGEGSWVNLGWFLPQGRVETTRDFSRGARNWLQGFGFFCLTLDNHKNMLELGAELEMSVVVFLV